MCCTMKPPSVGPMAVAVFAIVVQMPIARALSLGSGNAALTRARDVAVTAAAATPWIAREMLRNPSDQARPQVAEDAVKRAMPAR